MRSRVLCTASLFLFVCLTASAGFAATKTWTAGNGNWSVPANWSGGTVPAAGDDVVINGAGAFTVTLDVNSLALNSLTLGDSSPDGAQTLQIINSGVTLTLSGASTIHPDGRLVMDMGALTGSGTLNVSAGGEMILRTTSTKSLSIAVINNSGLIQWSGGQINSGGGLALNNLAGGLFDIQTAAGIFHNLVGIAPVITNSGVVRKSAGAGVSNVAVRLNNNGTVEVQTATLNLSAGGTHTGAFTGAVGATLQFGGGIHTGSAASSVSGVATMLVSVGSVTFDGNIDISGGVQFNGGTTSLTGAMTSLGNSISVAGGTATITGSIATFASSVSITGGTLNLSNSAGYTIDTLSVSNGTLDGSTALAVTGLTTWGNGGTLAGAGKLTVNGGMDITGTSTKSWRKSIDNPGTTRWLGGQINSGSGAVFNNLSGATFDIQTDQILIFNLGVPLTTFVNNGTIRKTAGAGTSTFDLSVDNNSVIDVQTGALNLRNVSTHDGTLTGAAATTLQFGNGTHTVNGGSSISGFSTLIVTFGTVNIAGDLDVTGTTQFNGGTTNLTGPIASLGTSISLSGGTANLTGLSPITSFANTVTINSGSLNLSRGASYTIDTLTIANGTLDGSSALVVSGLTTWSGNGTLAGAGKLTVNGGLDITGVSSKTWRARTIDNPATTRWLGGQINSGSGAVFNNLPGGTFDIQTDQTIFSNLSGTATKFVNDGVVVKSAGGGSSTIDLNLDNNSRIEVQTGTLVLRDTSTHDGTITGAAGTTLQFGGGTHTVNAGTSISGFGIVHFASGTVSIAGSINVTGGRTQFTGATANLTGPIPSLGNTVEITGGIANINNGGTVTVGSLDLSNGTLDGSTSLVVTGLTNWAGAGILAGAGKLSVNGGMEIIGTSTKTWRSKTIDNPATTIWTGAGINTGSGATFNNFSGAVFDIRTDQTIHFNLGIPASSFVNDGIIRKSEGAGASTLDIPLDNNSRIEVQTGTLILRNTTTHDGTITGAAGTTLQFNFGTHTINAGSSISGVSTVQFAFGTVNMAGSLDVTGGRTDFSGATANLTGPIPSLGDLVQITGGTANIDNGETVTVGALSLLNGTLDGSTSLVITGLTRWSGSGILAGSGKLSVNGGLSIDGTGTKTWRTRHIDNPANTTWTGPSISTGSGATFNNLVGGVFEIRTDQTIHFNLGNPPSNFVNDGTIRKSAGAGTSTLDIPLDNNGSLEVQIGTLNLRNTTTHDGTLTGASGTTLQFGFGTHTVNTGSSISGISTLLFTSGTVNVAGTIDISGGNTEFAGATANLTGPITSLGDTVSVNGGTANINNGASVTIGTLTLSGGTLDGNSALNVTGPTEWTGTVLDGTGKLTVSGGMNISGLQNKTWRNTVIDNPAVTTWTGTAINTGLGATFNNLATGTFDIQSNQSYFFNLGSPASAFVNAGTVRKSAGTATSTIDVAFTSTGVVEANVGTLAFTKGYTQTDGVTRLNGGSISTSVAPGLDVQGGILTGAGTIFGNVRNGGTLNAGHSPGTLSITGSYTQTASGILNAEISGLAAGSEHDQITVGGVTTLAGTLNATNISPFEPNEDDFFTIMTYPSVSGDFAVKNLNYGPGRNYVATRNPTNYTLTASVVEADLGLSKTGPSSVPAASTITYTLNVTNGGPDASNGIIVKDTLDPRVTFVDANDSGYWSCSHASQVVTCTATAELAAGTTSENIVINVTAPAFGLVSNSASVTAAIHDPNNANNWAGPVRTEINPVADLTITKSDSADPVDANATFQYIISVTNNGPSAAAPTTVTDTLPAGVGFVSAGGIGWSCSFSDPVVTCTAASIGVGTAPNIVIEVTAPNQGGTFSNTATVTSPADQTSSSDTETTDVLAADLAVSKSAPASVTAGANFDYIITVQNLGPSTATGVSVSDPLDPNVTFVSANTTGFWNCAHSSSTVTCTATANLSVGAAPEDITIVVMAPSEPMTVSNSASVTSSTPDPGTGNNNSGTVSTSVTAQADVSIVKSASSEPIAADQELTFTLSIQNAGPSTATNLVVTDVLDPRYAFLSADGGDWSCQFDAATNTVTCDRPSLAAGAAPAIAIVVQTPFEPAVVPNTATVTSSSDPDSSDNSSSINTTVTAAVDLAITKSDSPDPVILGTTLTYTVVVTNAGPSAATSVSMTDVLPSSVTFISATPNQGSCDHSSGTVSCSLGSIARSGSATITIEVRPDSLGVISNSATTSAPETDTNPANNSATEATTVGELRADLSITKLDTPDPVDAGAELTYTIQVTNAGPDAAASVTVTDVLPPGVTLISAGGTGWTCSGTSTVVCSLVTLAVGPAEPLTIVVTVASEGTVTNTASVSSTTTDPDPANNSAEQTTMVLPADADLFVIKTANPERLNSGAELTYEVTVGNNGPALASNVVMTDTLPSDVDLLSVEPSDGTCTGSSTITCDLGSIARDTVETVVIRVRTRNPGTLANTAQAEAAEEDPDLSNNSDSVTTIVDPPGNVSITKTGPSTVVAGGDAAYVIQVTNDSDVPLSEVIVRDNFPPLLAYKRWTCSATAGSSCGKASGTGNINIKVDLTPGGVATFEAFTKVVAGACGAITNTATIQLPAGVVDANPENNSSSTTATVLCRADR